MDEPQWLTLSGICSRLNLTPHSIRYLARHGYLGVLKGSTTAETRYLDPTPEYAAKLRLGETLYKRNFPLPCDVDLAPLLTLREIATIMGWTMKGVRNKNDRGQLGQGVKVGQYRLYSVQVVRDLLWKRQGRRHSKQRDPFLLEELIQFFQKYYAQECSQVPTDLEFQSDARLQAKLARLLKDPPGGDRDKAIRSLVMKMKIARQVVALATESTTNEPPADAQTP
jgi:hypothetical protein